MIKELTAKDILNVLADYSVLQNVKIKDSHKDDNQFYGLVSFPKMEIYISENIPHILKLRTLIHEILHAHKKALGIKDSEKDTEAEELIIYNKIYGDK